MKLTWRSEMTRVLLGAGMLGLLFICMFTASPIDALVELFIVGILPATNFQIPADGILLSYAIVLTLSLTSLLFDTYYAYTNRTALAVTGTKQSVQEASPLPKRRYASSKSASSATA